MDESIDRLRDTFRAAGRRLTSQRRSILKILEESETHLDAEMLFVQAKARDPEVSLATVYRTLAVLEEMGLVEKHSLGEEHGHFEAVHDRPHYHFVCRHCGDVVEFDVPSMDQIVRGVSEEEGVCILDVHLRLSGYCARCRGEREG